jgi:DNA-binding CsgD family transcriptional regulator
MNPWNLTEREEQVVAAVAEHRTDKLAARALGISPKTIDHHLRLARARMGADDRHVAVSMWDNFKRGE